MTELNINWHYHQSGHPSGFPMLLLHGFMGHGGIWRPVMDQLPDNTFALAPDLPGHGETTADLNLLDFDSLSDAIIEFIKLHFDTPPVMIGYSMGGRIALYTALKYPERFSALVLESVSPGIEDSGERENRLKQDQLRAKSLRQNGLRAFLADWYEQPLFATVKQKPGMVTGIIQKKLISNPENLAEAMVRLSPGRQKSLWEDLNRWSKPALIIAGEQDEKYCEISRRIAGMFEKADLKIIPDAGHIVHLENKKDFTAALNFFLASYII